MKYSYKWLSSLVDGIPAPTKLAELLTFHSFEVEEVKKIKKDTVFDIDVLPNRMPDVAGHEGLAREIAAVAGKKLKIAKSKIREGREEISEAIKVNVTSPRLCPRYTARVIEGVRVKRSPEWLRERLVACGLKPINNLVDAANYVMLATGQPLHVFDYDKIEDGEIIVRRSRKGEKLVSLDNETHELPAGTAVIADSKGPIAIAGIKGGLRTGVEKKTKRIVLESANFNRSVIRKTSKQLLLVTDASVRFSVGLDPELAGVSIEKLAYLIQDLAGGEIRKGMIDIEGKKQKQRFVAVHISEINTLLGMEVSFQEVKRILKRLGFSIKREEKEKMLLLGAPPFRMDIINEPDVIEEIGRVKGYEKISARPQHGAFVHIAQNEERFFSEKLRDTFSYAGFMEVMNYVFMHDKQISCLNVNAAKLLELENPANSEERHLRNTLLGGLLRNIEQNRNYRGEILFFELGNIFSYVGKKHKEQTHCTAILSENVFQKKPGKRTGEELFFEAKGCASTILERIGIADYRFVAIKSGDTIRWPFTPFAIYHPFRNAHINIGNEHVGVLYEIHPEILHCFGIKRRVIAFEFIMPTLMRLYEAEKEYRPISKYPSVIRDIAILVLANTRVYEVANIIERVGGKLLIDTDLFDFYKGGNIEEGKKSFAFHLIFQSPTRTLTDKEIDDIMQNIIRALKEKKSWEIR